MNVFMYTDVKKEVTAASYYISLFEQFQWRQFLNKLKF
jgi:hypothetical protein